MPRIDEVFDLINSKICLKRPQVIIAKKFILNEIKDNKLIDGQVLLRKFQVSNDGGQPSKVVVNELVDSSADIAKAIVQISLTLAFSEAIWALIHNNCLMLLDGGVYSDTPNIAYTTRIGEGSGQSGGWQFVDWKYSIPNHIAAAPSMASVEQDYLIEPDLFLKHMNINSMQSEVREALTDAILCFRAELYTPCLAMITKAIEGAWAELGNALFDTLEGENKLRLKSFADVFSEEHSSVAKITRKVLEMYEEPGQFSEVKKQSKVKTENLRHALIWADNVRESRNSLHYGNDPILPNDFEKVATLLLSVPAHFALIYNVIDTCKSMSHG